MSYSASGGFAQCLGVTGSAIAGADYQVAYPNYAGQQGIYAFDPQPLLQP